MVLPIVTLQLVTSAMAYVYCVLGFLPTVTRQLNRMLPQAWLHCYICSSMLLFLMNCYTQLECESNLICIRWSVRSFYSSHCALHFCNRWLSFLKMTSYISLTKMRPSPPVCLLCSKSGVVSCVRNTGTETLSLVYLSLWYKHQSQTSDR